MNYPSTPQRKACNCSDPCISTDDVYYAGPNLPNSGINTYDVLTEVIEKLDAIYAVPTLQRVTEMGNVTTLPIIADSFVKIGGDGDNILLDDGTVLPIGDLPAGVTETSQLINDGEDGINPFITALDIPAFNPSDYDLDEFTNLNVDPFAHISDIPAPVATALVFLDEGNGNGIVRSDSFRDPALFGNIGLDAFDLSWSDTAGNYGATGASSFAVGDLLTAQGYASFLIGQGSVSSVDSVYTFQSGFNHNETGIGYANFFTGAGHSVTGGAYATIVGQFANVVTNDPNDVNDGNNTMFAIGNGRAQGDGTLLDRSTALQVYRDGRVIAPSLTTTLITAEVTGKVLVTKEYLTTNNAEFVHRAGDTMLGNLILNADPSTALGAATKQYVDNVVSGINFHPPVVAATDVPLVATYDNGIAGVGATLTGPSVGVLMIDGETPAYLDRILVWQQADPIQNGIYDLTTVGDSVTVYQLTRSSDADNNPLGEIHYGDYTLVLSGDTNGGFGFICNTPGVIDIGITPITYIQFNAAQAVTAGYGLKEVISNVIEIDPLVTQEKITLTITGVGAATLDPLTHVLNIPTPSAETTATIGALIGSAGNATPNNSDFVATALTAGGLLQKITWANVKAFLKTYFDAIYSPNVYNILIESITTISTDTLGLYGSTLYSQNGKNVMINNSSTNIIFQVNTTSETNFTASYTKLSASGVNITFANGTASVISPTGLFVLSGLPGSTATLTRHLDTYYLLLNNL